MSDRGLPGAELARRFSADVAEPLLSRFMPGLPYAAARLGSGSDVLGLDDEMSRDHDWGCRLTPLPAARCPMPAARRPNGRNWPALPARLGRLQSGNRGL